MEGRHALRAGIARMIMPTIKTLKSQAKLLRTHLSAQNIDLGHSQALEAISAIYGFKDWNTASAGSPIELVYPSTDETGEQLIGKVHGMTRTFAKMVSSGPPLSADEAAAFETLCHQIGVAISAEKESHWA
jgi:hypothetical protein